ncbi:SAM-dependent methyltransferase [Vibrio parahaemolyticus]|uniref:class I SAM-dependent DNA methyltransferase n=1 Tax=Vibrio parahaemolyticus TaxID=670 RepID=UPI0011236629|nr:DNA methyltransferase [Vibrio parahaemolyticus]TNZ71741.1 SAM-dependent methyltransferase [Vibrio parahaemolyticus]
MKITYTEVHDNLRQLSTSIKPESYVYDFLNCFGTAKASITRLKKKFSDSDEVISNGQIHFKKASSNLEQELDALSQQKSLKKNKIRFVFVTDFKTVFARDVKADDTIQLKIEELHDEFEFFLPLAGMERASLATESIADAKAAEKMAKLFDLLKVENAIETEEQIHAMNVFLSRVLFCFFAEDTGIFAKDQFTKTLGSLSHDDGSNVHTVMEELFSVLDTTNRENCSNNFKSFPYVNGGLFAETISIPHFNTRSRRALIECGSLDWSAINPDIFGSMIQAVMDVKKRSEMGMHYTSVQNIMKVLSPLFLDKLTEEYLKILDTDVKDETKVKNLKALCARLSKIKIGDMACGSGNFLIIAYKELRQLEMKILKAIRHLEGSDDQMNLMFGAPQCGISLGQFYGIEYDDFACSIAILSLWLVEHQMNQQFNEEFGASEATLPLKSFNNIIHGNALRIDWNAVMPNEGEVYIVGNPPFYGTSMQTAEQKADMDIVFGEIKNIKKLDYVSCWFKKGHDYLLANSTSKCAFISTDSICQGEQVALLWPHILKAPIEIDFAHRSFKWSNNAKYNAGVSCIVVGLRNTSSDNKYIYQGQIKLNAKNINGYLLDGSNVFVGKEKKPLFALPSIDYGSKATDGGHLIMSTEEKDEIINNYPQSSHLIKKYLGSDELIKGKVRWCLWIYESDLELAKSIPPIAQRIELVRQMRLASSKIQTRKYAETAFHFEQDRYQPETALFIPSVSSENRLYIPMEYQDKNTVASNANFAAYNLPEYAFAILSSCLHTLWVKTVGGALETRLRYSNTLCYNTFPIPALSDFDKEELRSYATQIIRSRIMDGGTLAQLYDPKKMPDDLRNVHRELDTFVDSLYQKATNRSKPIATDAERLEVLFKMYAEMKEQQ